MIVIIRRFVQGVARREGMNMIKELPPMGCEEYSKAIAIFPEYFKALFNRGFAYDKIGEYDQAIKDYSRALEIDPENAFAYYNRGISYDRMGNLDFAYKVLVYTPINDVLVICINSSFAWFLGFFVSD